QDRAEDERHVGKTGEVAEMQVAGHEVAGVRAENAGGDERQPVACIDPGKVPHAGFLAQRIGQAQVRQILMSWRREGRGDYGSSPERDPPGPAAWSGATCPTMGPRSKSQSRNERDSFNRHSGGTVDSFRGNV